MNYVKRLNLKKRGVMKELCRVEELKKVQNSLKKCTMAWAMDKYLDQAWARGLREKAAALHHEHYFATIPYYAKVCALAGVPGTGVSRHDMLRHCMLTDDIFKSYPQGYLDACDFKGMNAWLSNICDRNITFDTTGLGNADQWMEVLASRGIHLVYSSGTSGNMSFVPRDQGSWDMLVRVPFLYVPFLLADRGLIPAWKLALLRLLAKNLSPDALLALFFKVGLRDFDGFFLNFSGGNQGIQLVGQEIGKLCGSAHFLYQANMSAAAVRAIVRGPKTPMEHDLAAGFLETTVRKKDENYERLIAAMKLSVKNKRKVLVFGAPFLLVEICRKMREKGLALRLKKGSGVVFGGGWKSFDGSRISHDELLRLLGETFGLAPNTIVEGYSMTEINCLMMRCPQGRFHVPPHMEAVILDAELAPMSGDDLYGVLGFLDPFADSYPGFLVTGDSVRLVNGPCACGRPGPAIIEVERTPGKEVKGCGGIMAKINA